VEHHQGDGSKVSDRTVKVFVHLDATGARFGNGGFSMLVQFAQGASHLGYNVFVFDHQDLLERKQFEWLSWPRFHFDIARFEAITPDDVVVTSWLNVLLNDDAELIDGLEPYQIRVWDQGELLRIGEDGFDRTRQFVSKYLDVIAINNADMVDWYRNVRVERVIFLENWLRSSLFVPPRKKAEGTVGFQTDNFSGFGLQELVNSLGTERIIMCHGNQDDVASRMRASDFFVFYNRFPNCMPFDGEVFGLSLYEAMACGCICIARRHEGNKHLEDTIALIDSIDEVKPIIDGMDDKEKKERRLKSMSFVENRHRFTLNHKMSMASLLSVTAPPAKAGGF